MLRKVNDAEKKTVLLLTPLPSPHFRQKLCFDWVAVAKMERNFDP